MNRKERERERKRREILDAAMAVFAERGYVGATMAHICKVSEYPLGTIYKYFESKEGIFRELVSEKARQLVAALEECLNDTKKMPAERLHSCVIVKATYFQANQDYLRIYLAIRGGAVQLSDENSGQEILKMYSRMSDLYSAVFQEGVDKGHFRPIPARDVALLFMDMTNSVAWHWLKVPEPKDALVDRMLMAFQVLLDGIRKR